MIAVMQEPLFWQFIFFGVAALLFADFRRLLCKNLAASSSQHDAIGNSELMETLQLIITNQKQEYPTSRALSQILDGNQILIIASSETSAQLNEVLYLLKLLHELNDRTNAPRNEPERMIKSYPLVPRLDVTEIGSWLNSPCIDDIYLAPLLVSDQPKKNKIFFKKFNEAGKITEEILARINHILIRRLPDPELNRLFRAMQKMAWMPPGDTYSELSFFHFDYQNSKHQEFLQWLRLYHTKEIKSLIRPSNPSPPKKKPQTAQIGQ